MIKKIIAFVKRDIWRIPRRELTGPKGYGIRSLRVLIASYREFTSDQCALHASALTFYSLLSIVPVFAMAFGVAKGFGVDKILKEKLLASAQGQEAVFSKILEFSENFLQNTKGGLIAGIGLALLFWSIISVLTNIEQAFNHIWGIKKERRLGQKFTDYLSLMLVAPVFFIIASSASVFAVSQVKLITEKIAILGALGPVLFTILNFLPVTIFCGLLTYLYMFLPNGKIHFKSALIGGLVAGIIYQVVQWAYIKFQIGASSAGAVYGTFAALPLFLVWLQLSWRIVFYGAELAFAHQNEKKFEFEEECLQASDRFKQLLSLLIMHRIVTRFSTGLPPLTDEEIAEQIELPIRLTRDLLHRLAQANLLVRSQDEEDRDQRYFPAQDIGHMTLQFIISHLSRSGTEDIPMPQTLELKILSKSLADFEKLLEESPDNLLLNDLTPASYALKA